jgi:photosystem II stability/assembly factor-like uncharacterized protein
MKYKVSCDWFFKFVIIFMMAMFVLTPSWTQVVPGVFGNSSIYCISWGNGIFVAGGENGKISSSPDGIVWNDLTNSTFDNSAIKSIAFGNNKFVAVGNDGKIATSQDGITWTAIADSTFSDSDINDITFGNGLFVAVGNNNKMAVSLDGIAWAEVNGPFGNFNISAIAFGNDKFVAARWGRGTDIYATSSDGTNWTKIEVNFNSSFIYDISFGNYRFVAVGNTGNDAGFIYTSPDGTEWTLANFGIFGGQGFDIIATAWGNDDTDNWRNGRFVAVGSDGALGISDYYGTNWVALFTPNFFPSRGSPNPSSIYSIYANGIFVEVGERGRITTSPDVYIGLIELTKNFLLLRK